jgi:N-methylhydantoinase A
MPIHPARAIQTVARLARELGIGTLRAAAGIVEVANAAMARALRVISVERGHDPRAFTLVAFGGAAGVHACALAAELGITRVMIPRHPGLLSAIGMAEAPLSREYTATIRRVAPSTAYLATILAPLTRRGTAELHRDGVTNPVAEAVLQMRYLGQAHEIAVALDREYRRAFDAAHLRLYGYAAPERPVEVLTLRLRMSAREPRIRPLRAIVALRRRPRGAPHAFWWDGRRVGAPLHERDALEPGVRVDGAALLVEYSSTVLVPPDWTATVDRDRNLRIARIERRAGRVAGSRAVRASRASRA